MKFLKKYKKIIVMSLMLIIFLNVCNVYGATDPTLVTKLNTAFKKIQSYLVKLATPIAGVAIAAGVLMRKLSFGDDEKMAKGKKIIFSSIVGYAVILSIDLILKFVDALI